MQSLLAIGKMKQTILDKEDREFLKEEIKQHVLMYLLILVIASVVIFGIVMILEKVFPNTDTISIFLILGFGYLGFSYYKLKPMIDELNLGIKNVTSGRITDKKETVKYVWSGSAGADLATQPKFVEYYFTIDNQDVWVEEKYYEKFNVDDLIDIHFSVRNGRIIKISKEQKKEITSNNTRL